MSKQVKFNIVVEVNGKQQLVTAKTDLKSMAEEFDKARTASTKFRDSMLTFNAIGNSFQNVISGVQQIIGVMHSYTEAAAEQEKAELKLETVMRQRMNANDTLIDSIKELASKQQELGVIGDEVQLAGAQQLATFLNQKESIEKLLPAMNDLLAQQKDFRATGEDAVNVGNLMGKVMQGQTAALKRVGITFTDAQEKVLKYGNESQRAAMLASVITANVGHMNAELAKTDAGKAKQVSNDIGDLKEQVGALFARIEPTISAAGELGLAFMAIGSVKQGLKGIILSMGSLFKITRISALATLGHTAATKIAALATNFWGKQIQFVNRMQIAWTSGAKKFVVQAASMRLALLGLTAATGIGLAIMGVSSVISFFSGKTKDATKEVKKAEDAISQEEDTLKQTKTAIEIHIAKLKTFNGTKQQERKIVEELNDTYGKTMGYFSSVSDWYKALTKNSEAYCNQMVAEAKARTMANEIAQDEIDLRNMQYDKNGKAIRLSNKNETQEVTHFSVSGRFGNDRYTTTEEIPNSSPLAKRNAEIREQRKKIAVKRKQLEDEVKKRDAIKMPVYGSKTRPDLGKKKKKKKDPPPALGSVDWFEKKLEKLRKQVEGAGNEDVAKMLQADYKAVEQEFKDYKIRIGLEAPDKVEVKTYVEKLQEELSEARKTLENATTIEARVKASAEVDRIQAEINEATTGQLTIKASVDPSYIEKGSSADKRQSYSNAQQNVSMIEYDYKIGIVGEDEALESIAKINLALEGLGLNPIEFKLDTDDLDKAQKKMAEAKDSISSMFGAIAGLGSALEMPELNAAGTIAQAIATIALSFAQALSQSSSMGPWGWIAFAAAGPAEMTAVISSIKGATAFANGGVVSGPTLALVGEYAGARNNPEVIAPLNKLRDMIEPANTGGFAGGSVHFEIDGRKLVGVLANETRIGSKSGRRTGIKL